MKKRNLLLLIIAIMAMMCGCTGAGKQKEMLDYLNNRYQKEFTYVSKGDKKAYDNTDCYVFQDAEGRKFVVKDHKYNYADNYSAILYDEEITESFQGLFKESVKIFVNTQSVFFNDNAEYSTYKEYMECCSVINATVCITKDTDYDTVAEQICNNAGESAMSAVIHIVKRDSIDEMYSEDIDKENIIESSSFWIESGKIWNAEWKDEN